MSLFPLFLALKDKRCAVVGGGEVARRKVSMLLEHGARVEVISPKLCPGLSDMARKGLVEVSLRQYKPGNLQNAFLVIAATNKEAVNRQVAKEAMERRALVNVVDLPELSNFIMPSYLRRGDLTISVSTNGRSPALARKIRMELEKVFVEEYDLLASLVYEVRWELKQMGISLPSEVWEEALDLDKLLELMRFGRREEAKRRLLKTLEESSQVNGIWRQASIP